MTKNSSDHTEEMEFVFKIPNTKDTEPIRIRDILYFDPRYMNFDYDTQTIIFQQSKIPQDIKQKDLRFSLLDKQGNEKQNYVVDFEINWTIKDDFDEEADQKKNEDRNKCNDMDEGVYGI